MLKRSLYILIVSCLLLSCTDNSYRGTEGSGLSNEPIPVRVVVGDPDNMFVTKGHGAVDQNAEFWKGSPIYVYAFKKDLLTSFDVTSAEDSWNCLLDGSIDRPGSLSGKIAQIGELDSWASWQGQIVYYPMSTQPYDFYAYFIDDMTVPESSINRSPDKITMPVEIDGSQDLMSAKAEFDESYYNLDGYTEEEKANLLNYSFGAYTAAQQIEPVIYFKHHLVRLCFDFYAGYTESTGKQIYIDSVKVRTRTRGDFTVVSRHTEEMGVDFSKDTRSDAQLPYLKLKDRNGAKLEPQLLPPSADDVNMGNIYNEVEPMRFGESLLVAPDDEYQVIVYLTEQLRNGRFTRYSSVLNVKPGTGTFKSGNQYNLRYAIYGVTEVNVSVSLTEWWDGGSLTVGEDVDNPPTGRI